MRPQAATPHPAHRSESFPTSYERALGFVLAPRPDVAGETTRESCGTMSYIELQPAGRARPSNLAGPSDPSEHGDLEAKYHRGMRSLGGWLIVFTALQLTVAAAMMRYDVGPSALLVLVGGMAGFHLFAGVLLLAGRGWVNHLILGWSLLLVTINLVSMNLPAGEAKGSVNPGGCIGLLIAAVMLHHAANNVGTWRKMRAIRRRPGGSAAV